MSEKKSTKEEQLFVYLVSMFSESAWIALGKIKNPATDKTDRNLDGASLYIDLLDMIKNRMTGNLSNQEASFLDSTISNLKLNFMEETRKAEKEDSEKGEMEGKSEGEEAEQKEDTKEKARDEEKEDKKGKTRDEEKED